MFENINILTKLYSLKNELENKDDLQIINNLISKYNLYDFKLKKEYTTKEFASNTRYINKCIREKFNRHFWDKKLDDKIEEFFKSKICKDLIILRIKLNKEVSCYQIKTYRDTLNLYTIETINEYFK